jgi:hypothetical protein
MNFADGVTAKPDVASSDKKSDQQLHTILENLGRVAHQDDLHSGFTPRLDMEALERKAIHDRLGAIESQMKRRGSGGFARYLVGILIGVATILAWQSWTKPLAGHETAAVQPSALATPQAATVAQTASPETVVSKAPAAPSPDPEQMQQLTRSLTTLQQTADQIAATQDEMKRAIVKLASGVVEVLVRLPAPPPPQPPAAHKPTPTAPSSSRAAVPPHP